MYDGQKTPHDYGFQESRTKVNAIAGTPVDKMSWSTIKHFSPPYFNQVATGIQGIFLIRYRDNPAQLNPASVLYVSAANSCIQRQLLIEHMGEGNLFLPDLVRANPFGIYFQYVQCGDPKNAEVYLIRALGYPICN